MILLVARKGCPVLRGAQTGPSPGCRSAGLSMVPAAGTGQAQPRPRAGPTRRGKPARRWASRSPWPAISAEPETGEAHLSDSPGRLRASRPPRRGGLRTDPNRPSHPLRPGRSAGQSVAGLPAVHRSGPGPPQTARCSLGGDPADGRSAGGHSSRAGASDPRRWDSAARTRAGSPSWAATPCAWPPPR